MFKQMKSAILLTVVITLLTGLAYPLAPPRRCSRAKPTAA